MAHGITEEPGASGDAELERDARMTLMEHLVELRNRIVISLAAVFAFSIIGFMLYETITDFLTGPLTNASSNLKQCKAADANCSKLITTDFLSPFVVRLKLASYFGVLCSSPIVMWQIWRFVTPALNAKERKYALPFIATSTTLFAAGVTTAWFTLEKALQFLISIGGGNINVQSTADSYVTLVGLIFLGFGLSFQFPVLLVCLLLARVVTTASLRKYRRHAIVGIVVFAAVITPSQDPYTLFLMAGPMWLFYETSIVIGRVMKR